MDSLDYEVQCDQRDYAKAQLEVLKRIEIDIKQTNSSCKRIAWWTLVTAILVAVLVGAR